MRENEINGDDYKFISNEEYDKNYEAFFETVEYQFAPNRYAGEIYELDLDKNNLLVVSIEGFLSAVKAEIYEYDDILILVNIVNDDTLDIQRENRDPEQEERINKGVLKQFLDDKDKRYLHLFDKYIRYIELPLSELKTFRNDKDKCLEYFNKIIIDEMS